MDVSKAITPAEAGRRLGCSAQNIIRLCNSGQLVFVRTALGRLIDPQSLSMLLKEREGVKP